MVLSSLFKAKDDSQNNVIEQESIKDVSIIIPTYYLLLFSQHAARNVYHLVISFSKFIKTNINVHQNITSFESMRFIEISIFFCVSQNSLPEICV